MNHFEKIMEGGRGIEEWDQIGVQESSVLTASGSKRVEKRM